jgi:hypothetical protein
MSIQEIILALAAITSVSATAFVVVSVLWMRKLRQTVSSALSESAHQQVRTAQRLGDAIAQVQKQQRNYDQQLQLLAQANSQLRQGLATVATRLDIGRSDNQNSDHTIH